MYSKMRWTPFICTSVSATFLIVKDNVTMMDKAQVSDKPMRAGSIL
jgi:hypothetical protein